MTTRGDSLHHPALDPLPLSPLTSTRAPLVFSTGAAVAAAAAAAAASTQPPSPASVSATSAAFAAASAAT